MTFTTYLASTNQLTAWAVGTASEREAIRNAWERQAHFIFNQPGYSFRMAGERHAESMGISSEMVGSHIAKMIECRTEGCTAYPAPQYDGLCQNCWEQTEDLKAPPASWWDKLSTTTQYVLVGVGAVLIVTAAAVVMAVVGGR